MNESEHQLIDLLLDNALPDSEARHLLSRIQADPEAVSYLADRALLHRDLRSSIRRRSLQRWAVAAGSAALRDPNPRTGPLFFWPGLAAAAALLLLAAVAWLRPEVSLAHAVGAEFAAGFNQDTLIGQPVELKSGLVELHFRKASARVVIEAPARFRVEDSRTLRMERGRITAHVRDGRQGLRVLTPHTDVLDLGTRFAVDASDSGRSDVHVFEGQVEAGKAGELHRELLNSHQAIRFATAAHPEFRQVRTGSFVQPEEVQPLASAHRAGKALRAAAAADALRKDPALIGFMDFEESSQDLPSPQKTRREAQGRFPGWRALDFVDENDHAQLNLEATTRKLTLLTWVRLDRVPDGISALYHTDGWDTPGQVHWMILNNGQMRFAIHSAPASGNLTKPGWPESRVPLLGQLGRWLHLAAVYDADSQHVTFFTNGTLDSSVPMKAGIPAVLGPAQIGNWNLKNTHGTQHRRLSGRIDEIVLLSRCLSKEEVRQQFESGNPYQYPL